LKIDWKRIDIRDLAALVCEQLSARGLDAILVGGACVSIYTKNLYQSYDLDFVTHTAMKEVTPVLAELGFLKESSRHFIRKGCPFFIEFVAPPAEIGSEPLKGQKKVKTRFGNIVLMTPTDSIKDRLAAYYHWNDMQALEQALMIARAQKADLGEVRRWSEKEGHDIKFRDFMEALGRQEKQTT